MFETAAAARKRVWDAAPPGEDTTSDVRAMREEDSRIADENAAARSRATTGSGGETGQRLLKALGL